MRWVILPAVLALVAPVAAIADEPALTAVIHDSKFPPGHDTFNGLSSASDGRIYYVLSSDAIDIPARMFVYDPATRAITDLGDLNTACGETSGKIIVQGKSHVPFAEANGKLYFATHIGFYSIVNGMETMGIPPEGWQAYPGGHLLSYDPATGKFEDLAIAPEREGVLTMGMDTARGRIFGLTWPTGRFFRFDLATKNLKDFGPVLAKGESGQGAEYRTVCRSIVVDPRDGRAYYTDSEGTIHRYLPETDAVEVVPGDNMRKDYFGLYDPTSPGHMGYNWRQVVWVPSERQFYGVHGNSGYLFRFDPKAERIEVLDRLTSTPSQRAGMYDLYSYGYLGFTLGPDGRTLYYLTGAPVYVNGKRLAGKTETAMGESKGTEDLHLITYDIPTGTRIDHGRINFTDGRRPSYVNAIAIGKDGAVYTLSRVTEGAHPHTDLISISADQTQPKILQAQKQK
jgi:hypothetical protein